MSATTHPSSNLGLPIALGIVSGAVAGTAVYAVWTRFTKHLAKHDFRIPLQ